ncbi:MAG: cyclopropane-fatty-acyl-phospholipid synthase family protein [Alphaproteobacteria bacterium]
MAGFIDKKKIEMLAAIAANTQYGSMTVSWPDGSSQTFTGQKLGPVCDISFADMEAVSRVIRDGKMGFCEGIIEGEITSSNLPAVIEFAVLHDKYLENALRAGFLRRLGLKLYHFWNRNSRSGSAKNIAYHYDLGNDFYAAWLDPTMTYSSAVYGSDSDDLSAAQMNKYKCLAELADIKPGDHVLEIGCGWGGFARYVTSTIGARVTGITISKEQYEFAQKSLFDAGLNEKADLRLIDYRDLQGSFDKIVSIEMFEAVGEAYWPTYFERVAHLLKKGGRAAIQSITIDHSAFDTYKRDPDFIQRYIFPGGMLPSLPVLEAPLSKAGLTLVKETGYGLHYAKTLAEWRERFNAAWPELAEGRFDTRFKRMWELYLAYCEGGFRGGMIDVKQMLLMHK